MPRLAAQRMRLSSISDIIAKKSPCWKIQSGHYILISDPVDEKLTRPSLEPIISFFVAA
jgi:hypothetical protein